MVDAANSKVSDTSDPWAIYEATRDRLIALVRSLDDEVAASSVPLTPDWTVVEVLSHVCGLTADVAAGMRTGLGTPDRTRHQVAVRSGDSIDEICDEWMSTSGAMREAMRDDAFFGHRLTADLTTHLHDVQHAVGDPVDRDDRATRAGAHTYGRVVTDLLRERTGVALRVELTDGTTFAPTDADDTDLTVAATPFDFLRTATGRRSIAEVRALDWSADPDAVLAHLSPYGPLRDTDAGFDR